MEDTESLCPCYQRRFCGVVTVGSIRWRILKAVQGRVSTFAKSSYSGLDPMEDTERWARIVARVMISQSYSGLDPMEDTESHGVAPAAALGEELQWARSDGGY